MANFQIKVKRHDLLKQFPEIASEELGSAMTTGTEKVRGDAMVLSPVDRSFFRQSLTAEVAKPSPLRVIGRVQAPASHASIIEGVDAQGNEVPFGRRPGAKFPNVGELRGWVARRLGVSGEKQIASVAYLVGRAIARRGIKAVRPIGRAAKQNLNFMKQLFEDAADQVARRVGGK